nr:Uncharacterized protein conserved in archaea (DUF2120) [Moritella viscosa]
MDSDNYTNKFSIDKLLSYLDTLGVEVIFDLDKNDNLTIKTKRSVEKSRKKNIEILNSGDK